MLGQFAFGFLVAAVTLGGIYLGQAVSVAQSGGADSGGYAAHDGDSGDFHTDLFAIPHVDENGIVGYLTGRFVVRTNPEQAAASRMPIDTLIFDSLSRHFYAQAGAFATATGWSRLRESLEDLRTLANETAGAEVVAEVLIEQLDYFSKEDVRMGDEQEFGPSAEIE
ncbi:hypothetical protein [Oricola thermophila]|uniref:Flagellar basal body-associated FliL family protein n=1 Tax=Oricola thermophila TaxID=2742145 RepID=A0A6N1VFA7_9HYPH|nr:hypothetical protein [Oricola thermophila]QKV19616.1 hypothetical protein HTY61_14725 [Oricola thermophila]